MSSPEELHRKKIFTYLQALSVAKYVREDSTPCQIEEGLFLGSVGAASNKDALKCLNITHVLIVANSLQPAFPDDFVYKKIDVFDTPDANLKEHFNECFDFIDEARQGGGGVLVHCFAGRSRSVTIIIAYLMKRHRMSLLQAFSVVKSKRPEIAPNTGFMAQLQKYEKSLAVLESLEAEVALLQKEVKIASADAKKHASDMLVMADRLRFAEEDNRFQRDKLRDLRAETTNNITVLGAENAEKLAVLSAEREERIAAARAEKDAKIAAARAETDAMIAATCVETDAKIAELRAETKKIITAINAEKEEQVSALNTKINSLKTRLHVFESPSTLRGGMVTADEAGQNPVAIAYQRDITRLHQLLFESNSSLVQALSTNMKISEGLAYIGKEKRPRQE